MTILPSEQNLKTLADFLNYAEQAMNQAALAFCHGTDNAWDEAVAMACYILRLPPDIDDSVLPRELSEQEVQTLQDLLFQRIKTRKPLPYLVKQAFFAGFTFQVDESVLIPRSPFAMIIQNQFKPWFPGLANHILDLCTGSGCMAIAAAKYMPDAKVTASDLADAAIKMTQKNCRALEVEQQVTVQQSDLFNDIEDKFDIIMTNPPYVPIEEYESLPKEFSNEPRTALVAADHGFALVERILNEAHHYLNDNGILLLEVGVNQIFPLEERYPLPFIWIEIDDMPTGICLLTKTDLEQWGQNAR